MKPNDFQYSLQLARQEIDLLQLYCQDLEWTNELLTKVLTELTITLECLQNWLENLNVDNELAKSEQPWGYLKALENSSEAYLITDRWGNIREANLAAAMLLKVSPVLLIGKLLSIFVAEAERPNFREALIELLIHAKPIEKSQILLQPWECEPISVTVSVSTIYNSVDKLVGLCWLIQEITYDSQEIERLGRDLFHDSLTGLLNYSGFLKRFEHTLKMYRRHPERKFALLFIDLDEFKQINDCFGHLKGNLALQEVACRLSNCLRRIDTISRFGGDEFIILLEDIDGIEDARNCALKVQQSLNQNFQLNDREIELKASIGIVISNPHCQSSEEYLRSADLAMYNAKHSGGCCYRVAKF